MSVWEEIVDYTVPSNTTQVDFTGLNITKDDFIKIGIYNKNAISNAGLGLRLFANTDTTNTNYWTQNLVGNGGSVSSFRINQNVIGNPPPGSTAENSFLYLYLKLSENNKLNIFSNDNKGINDQVEVGFRYVTSINSFNTIDNLTFISSVSNSIGAGSRIQIYRLNAEKVADITVSSNTTQVDITGLNIDKGSEYLLVGYRPISAAGQFYLTVNGNTTLTNYYRQLIGGSGSTSFADRINTPMFMAGSGEESVSYTHIKLSNTGSFTYQAYGTRNSGTSLQLLNFFGSSTEENITSINQLNIITQITNAIATGSRFELYKLY